MEIQKRYCDICRINVWSRFKKIPNQLRTQIEANLQTKLNANFHFSEKSELFLCERHLPAHLFTPKAPFNASDVEPGLNGPQGAMDEDTLRFKRHAKREEKLKQQRKISIEKQIAETKMLFEEVKSKHAECVKIREQLEESKKKFEELCKAFKSRPFNEEKKDLNRELGDLVTEVSFPHLVFLWIHVSMCMRDCMRA
jgi:hypothetical protein